MEVKVPALSLDAKDSYDESVLALFVEDKDDNDGDGPAPCITLPSFPFFLERKRFTKKNAKAGVWKFFEVYSDKALRHLAYCIICQADVNYTLTRSTGMLTRQLRSKHRREYDDMLEEALAKNLEGSSCTSSSSSPEETDNLQSSIEAFVQYSPTFEKKCLLGLLILTNLCMFVRAHLSEKCANL
jgi:hypothetical protein